eukprot:6369054-Amphidinium_carterae.2
MSMTASSTCKPMSCYHHRWSYAQACPRCYANLESFDRVAANGFHGSLEICIHFMEEVVFDLRMRNAKLNHSFQPGERLHVLPKGHAMNSLLSATPAWTAELRTGDHAARFEAAMPRPTLQTPCPSAGVTPDGLFIRS